MKKENLQKNQLLQRDSQFVRILEFNGDKVFIIDCRKKTMPVWTDVEVLKDYVPCSEELLQKSTDTFVIDLAELDAESRKTVYERFTMIAPVLPYVADMQKRKEIINSLANIKNISKQTIRNHLCLYLAYQDIAVLTPKQKKREIILSKDEKNMRWALNKFFYTKNKNSLHVAYIQLLKEKYCDITGNLLPEYPSFYQLRPYH